MLGVSVSETLLPSFEPVSCPLMPTVDHVPITLDPFWATVIVTMCPR